jgi:hypothetical protein
MKGGNQALVYDEEPIEFEKINNRLKFKTSKNVPIILRRTYRTCPNLIKEKLKDVNL